MNSDGIETFIADNLCDTEIVRRAIEYSKTVAVDIIANDTDVLIMLMDNFRNLKRSDFFLFIHCL